MPSMETRLCANPRCRRLFQTWPCRSRRYCSRLCANREEPRRPQTLYAPDLNKRDRLFLHAERWLPQAIDLTPPIPHDWLARWARHCRFPLRRAEDVQHRPAWQKMLAKRAARLAGRPLCSEAKLAAIRDVNERYRHQASYRRAVRMGWLFASLSKLIPRPTYPGKGRQRARRLQGLPGLPQPPEEPKPSERLWLREMVQEREQPDLQAQCEAAALPVSAPLFDSGQSARPTQEHSIPVVPETTQRFVRGTPNEATPWIPPLPLELRDPVEYERKRKAKEDHLAREAELRVLYSRAH
jgi:hypothetical protein